MKKDKEIKVSGAVEIIVDGGYSPATISVLKGQTTKINFLRKDPSSCLEEIVLSDFSAKGGPASGWKIHKFLPLNQKTTIEIKPEKSGEFPFSCGMNMFHGKIIVK